MTLDPSVTPTLFGNGDDSPLFSLVSDDPISLGMEGGSMLSRWIPAMGTDAKNFTVTHLTAIGPEDFTGEDTYLDFIASQDAVGLCDFGPGSDFNGFEYTHTMHRMSYSNKNKPTYYNHYGRRMWQQSPRRPVRGGPDLQRQVFENDAEWTLAGLSAVREQHRNWVILNGDSDISSGYGMIDGLNKIISKGWVAERKRGIGDVRGADPIILNAASLNTREKLVKGLKRVGNKLLNRMWSRGHIPAAEDFVLVIGPTMWTYLAEVIAGGALTGMLATNVQLTSTSETWQRAYDDLTGGGPFGVGYFPIGQRKVPVLIDSNLERNAPLSGNRYGIFGSAYFLTRRFRGEEILQQYYLNWDLLEDGQPFGEARSIPNMQNGSIRVTANEQNNMCFWYGIEEEAAVLSRMQMLQAKIVSMFIEAEMENEVEGPSFTNDDWFEYDGAQAGQGNVIWSGM